MKLNATITTPRGKTASKSDDSMLRIELKRGNNIAYTLYMTDNSLILDKEGEKVWTDKTKPEEYCAECMATPCQQD